MTSEQKEAGEKRLPDRTTGQTGSGSVVVLAFALLLAVEL